MQSLAFSCRNGKPEKTTLLELKWCIHVLPPSFKYIRLESVSWKCLESLQKSVSLPSEIGDANSHCCHSRTLKILWHPVTKDNPHIPSSTAWAQHLGETNVALEDNIVCIVNYTEFFQRDLAQFWTYRVKFQQKSLFLDLGEYFTLYSWHSTP